MSTLYMKRLVFGVAILFAAPCLSANETVRALQPKLDNRSLLVNSEAAYEYAKGAALGGPRDVLIANGVVLHLPAGFSFSPRDSSLPMMKVLGHKPDESFMGLIESRGTWGYIVVHYIDSGHVAIERPVEDAAALQEELNGSRLSINLPRRRLAMDEVKIKGWLKEPSVDVPRRSLSWSLQYVQASRPNDRWSRGGTLTSNNVILFGRTAYLNLSLLSDGVTGVAEYQLLQTLSRNVRFRQGHDYSDFDPINDRYATYGMNEILLDRVVTDDDSWTERVSQKWKDLTDSVYERLAEIVSGRKR